MCLLALWLLSLLASPATSFWVRAVSVPDESDSRSSSEESQIEEEFVAARPRAQRFISEPGHLATDPVKHVVSDTRQLHRFAASILIAHDLDGRNGLGAPLLL